MLATGTSNNNLICLSSHPKFAMLNAVVRLPRFGIAKNCRVAVPTVLTQIRYASASTTTTSKDNKYSKTVLLPFTKLEQRANAIRKEPEIQKFWENNHTYKNLQKSNIGEKFVLHDGPPYANGELHIGHALNKILKDFINRYQILQGRKVHFVPGWDCHGLPIELKVLQDMKTKDRQALTPIQLRKKAAGFAKSTMESQRESFRRYGVWGEWDTPYLTLQPEYEAAQIRVFGDMVAQGHIYRGKRPVNWSPSSRTALAEAELEYPENHTSKSVYVGFKATKLSEPLIKALSTVTDGSSPNNVHVAIWTTTPWTLPANTAVAVNATIEYAVVRHPRVLSGNRLIVAMDLVSSFAAKVGLDTAVDGEFTVDAVLMGSELVGIQYSHPLNDRHHEIVAGGDYITTQSGTGLVHTAPGHGQEDYLTGLKYNLQLLSPVDDAGCFTAEAGERFVGLDVLGKGNVAVIAALEECGALLKEEAYKHKYPYDWRTKKPTICRMTEQWFASVSRFKEQSLTAIETVKWIPAAGQNRITAMVKSYSDWCISRQRAWGVPIPVFYHKVTNEPLLTAETIAHIEGVIRAHGADAWWEKDIEELLPPGPLRDSAGDYIRGTDTMDVWFDSGTSWAGVLQSREELKYPADLYLEGSDQHRGWFQSSLLTSVASQGVAPYKSVLTHGFVMDEKGYKMSKSLGNVVDPKSIIDGGANQKEQPAYGADTLRLWVSGVDYASDATIGTTVMKTIAESYRKIRNTLRFVLGCLKDFDPAVHTVPYEQLSSFDKNTLGKLTVLIRGMESSYDEYQFYKIKHSLVQYITVDVSPFYLECARDRLYVSRQADARRRSCQTVLHHMLEQLTVAMAPVLPHLAEEVWQSLPYEKSSVSVFESGWIGKRLTYPEHETDLWIKLRQMHGDVNKICTLPRLDKILGDTVSCCVYLHIEDKEWHDTLQRMKGDEQYLPESVTTNGVDDLRLLFNVSQVVIVESKDELKRLCPDYVLSVEDSQSGVTFGVTKAHGSRCARCYLHCTSVGMHDVHVDLCSRCSDVMHVDGHVLQD